MWFRFLAIFLKTNNFRRIRRALLAYVRCGGLALKGLTHSSTVSLSLECFPIQQMLTPCQFFSLHALPHFCICSRILFFLANIEFNVLVGNPSRFAMSTHFSPGFFSTSCIIFNRSCKVLTLFFGRDIVNYWKHANIDDSKLKVMWEAKIMYHK
jgi:hypothetical protein